MVDARETLKLAFASRLQQALDSALGSPSRGERGRAAYLSRQLSVSGEAASKWLDGRTVPDQTNIGRLAQLLDVTPQWLHAGQPPMRPAARDEQMERIVATWPFLSPEGRSEAAKLVEMAAAKYPKDPPIARAPTGAKERRAG